MRGRSLYVGERERETERELVLGCKHPVNRIGSSQPGEGERKREGEGETEREQTVRDSERQVCVCLCVCGGEEEGGGGAGRQVCREGGKDRESDTQTESNRD